MKSVSVRHILLSFVLPAILLLEVSCKGDTSKAAATATAFLQAYYVDLDFDRAKSLCADNSKAAVAEQAETIALNPYAKEETPNIVFKTVEINPDNANMANCLYTCNRVERKLPLRKYNGKWLVDLQGSTGDTVGNSDFIQLSQEGANGFASAVSGEIKYKKRRSASTKASDKK